MGNLAFLSQNIQTDSNRPFSEEATYMYLHEKRVPFDGMVYEALFGGGVVTMSTYRAMLFYIKVIFTIFVGRLDYSQTLASP